MVIIKVEFYVTHVRKDTKIVFSQPRYQELDLRYLKDDGFIKLEWVGFMKERFYFGPF